MSIFSNLIGKYCRITNKQGDHIFIYKKAYIKNVSERFILFIDSKTGKEMILSISSIEQIFEEKEEGGF